MSAFHHTRYDGPYDPCPECEAGLSEMQRRLLKSDRSACARDYGFYYFRGEKVTVSRWRRLLFWVRALLGVNQP